MFQNCLTITKLNKTLTHVWIISILNKVEKLYDDEWDAMVIIDKKEGIPKPGSLRNLYVELQN
jgi:hypothetical protein